MKLPKCLLFLEVSKTFAVQPLFKVRADIVGSLLIQVPVGIAKGVVKVFAGIAGTWAFGLVGTVHHQIAYFSANSVLLFYLWRARILRTVVCSVRSGSCWPSSSSSAELFLTELK